jgi:NifU-like protein involved in Fe-S cluster formation
MNDDLSNNPLVLDHFLNPRNVGDLPHADGVGEAGAVACGDVVRMSIRVANGRITEARFRTYGCGTAIACSSMATELILGRSIEEAARLSAACPPRRRTARCSRKKRSRRRSPITGESPFLSLTASA